MIASKKVFAALAVTAILLTLVANTSIFTTPVANAQGSGTIRVTTWESGDSLEPWNNAIAAFEAEYPDINVELEPVPQEYGTKLLAQMAAGTAPDVFQVGDGDVARFVREGIIEPLDPLIEADPDFSMDVFFPGVASFGQIGGETYLLTKDYSPLVLYYNKDHFDAAGLEYPNPDWTWDDLLAAAQALTTEDRWGFMLPNSWGDWLWTRGILPILVQNGAHLLSEDGLTAEGVLNSEAAVAAVQWYVDLFQKYGVAPTSEDVAAYAGTDFFANGLASMMWTGRWPLKDWRAIDGFNFGTMGLPAGPAGEGNTLCWAGLAINAASENKDAAWTFLKYIAAGDGAAEFANYAFTAVIAVAEDQGLIDDEYDGPIINNLLNVAPIPEALSPFATECVITPFQQNLERVFLEDVPVQEAMDAAAAEAQTCLDENNS